MPGYMIARAERTAALYYSVPCNCESESCSRKVICLQLLPCLINTVARYMKVIFHLLHDPTIKRCGYPTVFLGRTKRLMTVA